MLDPVQIRKQIDEAVGQRDVLKRQRDQMDAAIRTLDTYITVSEQMFRLAKGNIEHTSASSGQVSRKEQRGPKTRPGSLRDAIISILQEAAQPMTVRSIWEHVQDRGITPSSANPIDAVKFALFDLRKHGAPIERIGENLWRYLPTTTDGQGEAPGFFVPQH